MKAFFNHLNLAVIKNLMLQMQKEELQDCILFIRHQALNLPRGMERDKYVALLYWSNKIYEEKYETNGPSLF